MLAALQAGVKKKILFSAVLGPINLPVARGYSGVQAA
jgi:hypothetical protein